ncbi:MAG: hypothetical protein PHW63_04750 [Alphaproteobacteria bacterium]|nr:hypothetical protein [Alphaproteobacteria bacterium]
MLFSSKRVKALSLCLMLVALTACSGASKKADTYTNDAGAVTILDNDREACTRSCNAEFDRCSGTAAAESRVGRGQMTGIFGAQADCKDDMKACLSRCRAR